MTLRPIALDEVGVIEKIRDGRIWPARVRTPLGSGLGSVVYHLPMVFVAISWARLGERARSGVMESHANPRSRIS
jgi:hypothetical protein